MSNAQNLAVIIDRCLEDILLGVATVDECLERWPQHREELGPLLRAAVAVSSIPRPTVSAPDPARRAAFMAQLRETPQERPRFRFPGLPRLGLGTPLMRFASVAAPAAVVALIAIALVWSSGASTASAATLTVFAGQVEQQVDGSWQVLEDGSTLREGSVIRTGDMSFAMITFPDGSTATVDALTQLAFDRITVDGERQIDLNQASGRVWNDVVPIEDGDSYVIRTPHAVVEAHGTVFETIVNGETAVVTAEGIVSLEQADSSVQVVAGQIVRASAAGFTAPQPITTAGEIRVTGPVAAYLTSPEGAATGVLLNGLVFRQIPGVTTSSVEVRDGTQVQRLTVGDAEAGAYSLVLRRYGPGEGSVTVSSAGTDFTLQVPETVEIARLPLDLGSTETGAVVVRAMSASLESVGEAPQVRVVESERTREVEDQQSPVREEKPAEVVATSAAGGSSSAAPATPTAAATPARTPSAPPTPTATPDTFEADLRTVLAFGNNRELSDVLDRVLEGDDDAKFERLAVLAAVMTDPANAARIRSQLSPREVAELQAEAARLTPGLTGVIGSALSVPADDRGTGASGQPSSVVPNDNGSNGGGSGSSAGGGRNSSGNGGSSGGSSSGG
ncbi:MAG: FecR domain-containing protein, partial [Dehalococcoidia bacterium]|nr:FecR domain-containing protein [Dehalococcoidia bacterium]